MKINALSFDGDCLKFEGVLGEDLPERTHGAIRVRLEHGDETGPGALIGSLVIDFFEATSVYPKTMK